jgi:hypothetical protein
MFLTRTGDVAISPKYIATSVWMDLASGKMYLDQLDGYAKIPVDSSQILQSLTLTADANQDWISAVDSLGNYTAPSVSLGAVSQTDLTMVDCVSVVLDGTFNTIFAYAGELNGTGYYTDANGSGLFYAGVGSGWEIRDIGSVLLATNPSEDLLPPRDGWVTVVVSASLSYGNFWYDATRTPLAMDYEAILTHFYNSNGSSGLWVKKISDTVWQVDQYSTCYELWPRDVGQNDGYYEGLTGGLTDVSGNYITDSDGFVLFAWQDTEITLNTISPPEFIIASTELLTN